MPQSYDKYVTTSEPADLERSGGLTVLDVRDRDLFSRNHLDGAVNIPLDELFIRLRHEVDQSRPLIVDCGRLSNSLCGAVGKSQATKGFKQLIATGVRQNP